MAQDHQFSAARHADVVEGEVVPDEEESSSEYQQTYLHKVASARPTPTFTPADPPTEEEDTAPHPVGVSHSLEEEDDRDEHARDEHARDEHAPEAQHVITPPEPPSDEPPSDEPPSDEPTVGGRHRADEAAPTVPEPAPEAQPASPVPQARRPGDESVPAGAEGSLLADGGAIREQWMRIQAQFVDDPRAAVTKAANVITDVAARLEAAVRERQRVLRDQWDGDGQADTEMLRVMMQQYRVLLERLAEL